MHYQHPEIIKRLKKAQGHLASVIEMIVQQRGCQEIAQQLQAVENAIHSAKRILIHEHIEECILAEADSEDQHKIQQALKIAKYL